MYGFCVEESFIIRQNTLQSHDKEKTTITKNSNLGEVMMSYLDYCQWGAIDVVQYIGNHEFSGIPPSLFNKI